MTIDPQPGFAITIQVVKKTLLSFILITLAMAGLIGCQTAELTKTCEDGSQDHLVIKSFLSSIRDGSYSNGTGVALSVSAASPDQQSIAILAGGVIDLAKIAAAASLSNTNSVPVTNSVPQVAPLK